MELEISSPQFEDGQTIPKAYTGEGEDLSPELRWSNLPSKTEDIAILCEDPDAPQPEPFVHWLIYHITPSTSLLPSGIPHGERLEAPVMADQGRNSFGSVGYNGPLPPFGHGTHRYMFRIFALDREVAIPPGATKQEFLKAIDGHVLNEGLLIGVYERPGRTGDGEPRAA